MYMKNYLLITLLVALTGCATYVEPAPPVRVITVEPAPPILFYGAPYAQVWGPTYYYYYRPHEVWYGPIRPEPHGRR